MCAWPDAAFSSKVPSSLAAVSPRTPTTGTGRTRVTRTMAAAGGFAFPGSKTIRPRIGVDFVATSCTPLTSPPATVTSAAAYSSCAPCIEARRVYSPGVTPLMMNVPSGRVDAPPLPPGTKRARGIKSTNAPASGRPCASNAVPLTREVDVIDHCAVRDVDRFAGTKRTELTVHRRHVVGLRRRDRIAPGRQLADLIASARIREDRFVHSKRRRHGANGYLRETMFGSGDDDAAANDRRAGRRRIVPRRRLRRRGRREQQQHASDERAHDHDDVVLSFRSSVFVSPSPREKDDAFVLIESRNSGSIHSVPSTESSATTK